VTLDTHDIFDRIFKRIITLSSPTIVRFINGIFSTDYSLESRVTYNWTEHVDDELKKTISDTIVTINDSDSYHIEAQMYKDDNSILLRMFDYGFNHSKRSPEDVYDDNGNRCGVRLYFPQQVVIYLDSSGKIPDEYHLIIRFNDGHEFTLSVPTIIFQNESLNDIIQKNMIILLPFKLLKVRNRFEVEYREYIKTEDYSRLKIVIEELREIYEHDIIKTIENSYKNDEISRNDMMILIKLSMKLLDYLYAKYSSVKEVEIMLHDESLDLDIDRYIDKIDDLEVKLAEKDEKLAEKDKIIEELQEELKKYKS
jgi:hypothetical protein